MGIEKRAEGAPIGEKLGLDKRASPSDSEQ